MNQTSFATKKHPAFLCFIIYSLCSLLCAYKSNAHAYNNFSPHFFNRIGKNVFADVTVTGTVKDRLGKPIPDVTIKVVGSEKATTTNEKGVFSITTEIKSSLEFTHVSYKAQILPVKNSSIEWEVIMDAVEGSMEEVVVTAFGRQKRISQVGAQSSVRVSDLKLPTANLSTSLAGRIAGVIGVQRSGEPGRDQADIWIRGIATFSGFGNNDRPLVLVDGVERDINALDPEDIQEFSILKDASATAVYGVRGANGVVLIKTKTGKPQKPVLTVNYTQGISTFTQVPELADGVTYMHLTNEAILASNPGAQPKYSQDYINKTASGADPYAYPNVNWMDALFNKWGKNRRFNFSANGGATNAFYYISMAYYDETGFLKNDALSDYNADTRFKRYNFTSNLTLSITSSTKLELGVQGYISNVNTPGVSAGGTSASQLAFAQAMQITPVLFPVMYPGNLVPGQSSNGDQRNPYADITQRGYQNLFSNQVYSNVRLTQNLDAVIKGLSLTSMFAFDVRNDHLISRNKRRDTWYIDATNPRKPDGSLNIQAQPTFRSPQPNLSYSRANGGNRKFYTETSLNYNTDIGKNHSVSAMLLYNQEDFTNAFAGDLTSSIPFRYRGLAGRATYSWKDKYFAEFNFGYNGSENFAPEKRYGFFPSIGLGWIVSEEKFYEPIKTVIQFLKFRYSDGLVGSGGGGRRFGYLTFVNPVTNVYSFGINRTGTDGVRITDYGVDITWSTSRKQDLGIELQTLNNKMKLTVDLFKEHRKNVFIPRGSTPSTLGLNALPVGNLGVIDNKGFDLTLESLRPIEVGNIFFSTTGTFSYAKNKVIEDDSPVNPDLPWQNTRGLLYNSPFFYIAEGLFASQDEISKSPDQSIFGTIRPGDIRYKDMNGDGKINSNDRVRLEKIDVPAIVYGFGLSATWKGFYTSAFFQGTAKAYRYINGDGVIPFSNSTGADRSNLFAKAADRWTPANPNPNAFYPRLGFGVANNNNIVQSTWWVEDVSFLRLKVAELGYNLPIRNKLRSIGVKNARIYLQGTNLLTFSKFDLWDPELNTGNGTVYPLVTAYSLGVQASF